MRRIGSILSLLLLASCASTADKPTAAKVVVKPKVVIKPAFSRDEIQQRFDAGVKAMNAKPADYGTAVKAFQAALKPAPKFWEAHLNLGLVFHRLRSWEDAERHLLVALDMAPDAKQRELKLALGKLLLDMGRYDDAEKPFQDVLVADPDDLIVKHNLAVLYRLQKDYETSMKFVREVLARDAKNIPAHNTLGLLYLDQGNLSMASWIFGKALKYEKEHSNALNNMGLVWMRREQIPTAVSFFQRAVKANPDHADARMNLGAIYLSYLAYDKAREQYERVLALRKDSLESRIGFAGSLFGLRKYDEAAAEYLKVVEVEPRNATAYMRLGRLHEEFIRDQEKALKYFEEYVRVADPADATIVQKVEFMRKHMRGAQTAPTPGAASPAPETGDAATAVEGEEAGGAPAKEGEATEGATDTGGAAPEPTPEAPPADAPEAGAGGEG